MFVQLSFLHMYYHHWGKAAVRNLSYVPPNMADGDTGKFTNILIDPWNLPIY
jgi:hypothetical protein